MTIGVLISGGGTNLQAIMDAIDAGHLPARIGVVVSGRSDAYGMTRAQKNAIPVCCLRHEDFAEADDFDDALLEVFKNHNVELVVLAGYLKILSKKIIKAFPHRIINVHPSLIPAFCGKGYYGEKVHKAVLDYGVRLSGATVHFVDEGADTGPIILQEAVTVADEDDVKTLAEKVLKAEHRLLVQAIRLYAEGRLAVVGRKVSILAHK